MRIGVGAAPILPRLLQALDQGGAQRPQLVDLTLLQINLSIQLLYQILLSRQLDLDLDQPLFQIHKTPVFTFWGQTLYILGSDPMRGLTPQATPQAKGQTPYGV